MTLTQIPNQPNTLHTATLRDPLLISLEAYWQKLRHANRLPARNDFNPAQIDKVLPNAFILQRVAPGTARFRVAGQKLHDVLKLDARGMPFTTLFETAVRDDIKAIVETAFCEPAIVGIPLISKPMGLRPTVRGSLLLLPMRDAQDQTTRLLGALVTEDFQAGRARRFMIDTDRHARHETVGLKLAATQLVPRTPAPSKKPDTSLRPALRLVINNG